MSTDRDNWVVIRPALLSATGGSSIATMRNKKAPKSEKHPCIK